MNEGHPSGFTPDYDAHAYGAYSPGSYQAIGTTYAEETAATGTYGHIPQQAMPYDPYAYGYGGYDPGATGSYPTAGYGGYDAGTDTTGRTDMADPVDPYAAPGAAAYYDTGSYDTTALWQPEQQAAAPQQDWDSGAYPAYGYGYGYDASGDTGLYERVAEYATGYGAGAPAYDTMAFQTGTFEASTFETGSFDTSAFDTGAFATGGYDTTAFAPDALGRTNAETGGNPAFDTAAFDAAAFETGTFETAAFAAPGVDTTAHHSPVAAPDALDADELLDDVDVFAARSGEEQVRHDYAPDGEPAGVRGRRAPRKRSALLTVAVPSVAVLGVAAVSAAAIGGVGSAQDTSKTTADGAQGNAPTTQLDRQLSGVSRDADDFATRANRSQERVDLKDRQEAAKRAAAAAAARKEALRPKFVLPVKQKGLSAYFGQSGEHWMALHTGIDFPVQVGTPVMAVTDGTVRTQWNSSYGNMAIVTAPDGTETWYCHLSSTKIRSGKVKAGTVIAYSGNTGNTTGPHLHLEVRPHGGAPIDPLPWLLSHGLDPR
ncbi:M23 family metallopeptidase [Actinacidiphila guanduensis]|uniref:Peptidase family M23 n=1 Tax=Actinacidiphila guanduensis TaxID=310781 RepID=A0A1H0J9R8_9ACTN|nr:M23 family metallopeptidase [Actinacidiphila guanduensis]SDO40290.1 Peptidase family M23 [Actinacidiphila guanduensis]